MQSIILTEPGHFELTDTPLPSLPAAHEAQVRILRVGICGTDLHAFAGHQPFFTYPRILGHELAVEIVATGTPHPDIKPGMICCVRPYLNCGDCGACRRGYENACQHLQTLGVHRDGGMREIINVPLSHLHASTLPPEQLAMVEMLSIGAHAVRRAQVLAGETVLVIGMGPIGLGVSQFAKLAGAQVIAMDISEFRLAFARQQPGIDFCIDARQDVLEQLQNVLPNDLPTVVFDATGNAGSMLQAFDYVAHGGKLVFVGLFQGDVTFHDPNFHRREMTLLASRNATAADFSTVLDALETGSVQVDSWITHHATPEQLIRAFPSWLEPATGVIKAILSFK